jgi:hypothetical protein
MAYTAQEIEQARAYFLANPTKSWFHSVGDGFGEGEINIHRDSVFGQRLARDYANNEVLGGVQERPRKPRA